MDEQTSAKVTQLLKAGDRAQAEVLLKDILRRNPRDDQAWLWVTQVLTNDKQRLECVNRALEINPGNAQAQQYKQKLIERMNAASATPAAPPAAVPKPAPPPSPPPTPSPPPPPSPASTPASRPASKFNLPPTQPLPPSAMPPFAEPEPEEETGFEELPTAVDDRLSALSSPPAAAPLPASSNPPVSPSPPSTPSFAPLPVTAPLPGVVPPPAKVPPFEAAPPAESASPVAAPPPSVVDPPPPIVTPPPSATPKPAASERFESLRVPAPPPPPRRSPNLAIIGVSFFVILIIGAILVGVYLFTFGPLRPTPPPPTVVVVVPTVTVINVVPTFPPVWTATFTPTSTVTPTPLPTATATPAPAATLVFETGAIAYQRAGSTTTDIFVTDGKSSGTNLTGREFVNVFPAWSPDGGQIAFASVRNTALADIYVMNADGTDPRPLTDDEASDTQPAWSPDGTRLVFVSDRAGDNDLYLMNADGSEQTPLSSVPGINEIDPAWSPDGTQILFTYSECPESGEPCHDELYVLNAADGSGLQQLTQGGVLGSAQPAWSPDGQLIVFVSDTYGEEPDSAPQLVLMNADGSDTRPLGVAHLSDMSEPAWSPDGGQILFVASSDLGSETEPSLFVVPLRCFDAPDVCLMADLFRIPITGPAANPQWRRSQ